MMLSRRLPTFDFGSHLQSVLASSALALACVGSLSLSLREFFAESLQFSTVSDAHAYPSNPFAGWKLSSVGDARTQLDELFFQNEWLRSVSEVDAAVETPRELTTPVRLAVETRSSIKAVSARRPIARKIVPIRPPVQSITAPQPTAPTQIVSSGKSEIEVSYPESDRLDEPSISSALTAPVFLDAGSALTVYRSLHARFGQIAEAAFDHRAFSAEPQLAISTTDIDAFPDADLVVADTVSTQESVVAWNSVAVEHSETNGSDASDEASEVLSNGGDVSNQKPGPQNSGSEAQAISIQTLPHHDEIQKQRFYPKEYVRPTSVIVASGAQIMVHAPTVSEVSPLDPLPEMNSQLLTTQSSALQTKSIKPPKNTVSSERLSNALPAARLVPHKAPAPVIATNQTLKLDSQAPDYSSNTANGEILKRDTSEDEYSTDSADEEPTFTTIPTRADQSAVFAETFQALTQDADLNTAMNSNPPISIASVSNKVTIRTPGVNVIPGVSVSNSPSPVRVSIPSHSPHLAQTGLPSQPEIPFVPPAPPVNPDPITPPKKVVVTIPPSVTPPTISSLTSPDFSFTKTLTVPPSAPNLLLPPATAKPAVTISDRNAGSDQSYRRCTLGPFGKRAISRLPVFQNDLMVCKRILSFEGEIDATRTQWIEARIGEDVPGEYYPTIAFQKLGASDTVFGRIPMLSRDDVRQFELLTGIRVERELGIVMGEITDGWMPEWSGRAEPAIFLGENFERIDAAHGDRAKYFVYLNVKPGNNLLSMKSRLGQTLGAIAPIVRGGTVTYLKPPKSAHREVRVRVLDGMATAESGLSQVTVEVIGQPAKSALTRADGTAGIRDVTFFGDFPVYVDVIQSSRSYRHRFQINLSEAEKVIDLFHFDPQTVGHWLAQVDRGVSGESGLVVGVRAHQASTDAHSYLRLFRMDGAALLREDTYGIARDESLRSESQMSAETSRFLMVQVPEGMHVLGDFSEDSRLRWSETIIAQPGVINVTRPH